MGLLNRRASRVASSQKIEKEFSIVNRLGLHARQDLFCASPSRYRSKFGWRRGEEVNGKVSRAMMLATGRSRNCASMRRPDADKAIEELEELINAHFNKIVAKAFAS
jgi:phosphotransferase system HPr-like phosphotransfer protein